MNPYEPIDKAKHIFIKFDPRTNFQNIPELEICLGM